MFAPPPKRSSLRCDPDARKDRPNLLGREDVQMHARCENDELTEKEIAMQGKRAVHYIVTKTVAWDAGARCADS
eukprot:6204183-Pleurochrysis_carterae.AAC.1